MEDPAGESAANTIKYSKYSRVFLKTLCVWLKKFIEYACNSRGAQLNSQTIAAHLEKEKSLVRFGL